MHPAGACSVVSNGMFTFTVNVKPDAKHTMDAEVALARTSGSSAFSLMTGGVASLACVRLAVSVLAKALMKFWTDTYLYLRSLSLQQT